MTEIEQSIDPFSISSCAASDVLIKLEIRDSQNLAKLGLGGQLIWSEGMG